MFDISEWLSSSWLSRVDSVDKSVMGTSCIKGPFDKNSKTIINEKQRRQSPPFPLPEVRTPDPVPPGPYTRTVTVQRVCEQTYINRYGEKTVTVTRLPDRKETYDIRDDYLKSRGFNNGAKISQSKVNPEPFPGFEDFRPRFETEITMTRSSYIDRNGKEQFVYKRRPDRVTLFKPLSHVDDYDSKQLPPSYDELEEERELS